MREDRSKSVFPFHVYEVDTVPTGGHGTGGVWSSDRTLRAEHRAAQRFGSQCGRPFKVLHCNHAYTIDETGRCTRFPRLRLDEHGEAL
jgi:hypothetical protein